MKRIVTAFLLVPVAVYAALFAPWWFFLAVIAIVASLCFREYAAMTNSFAPLGYVAGILILIAPQRDTILLIVLTALAAMCLPLASRTLEPDLEKSVSRSASLLLGIVYIFGAWKTAILLHDSAAQPALFGIAAGHHWLLFGLMVNWVGDTGAYYVGKNFGRRKLAPSISPGKTWEGAAASAVTGVAFGLIYLPLAIKTTPLLTAGLLALAANIAGQAGDLAESAIKRGVGVKDSGTMLPGHGGFLDRVDSSLFALPVLYTLLNFLNPQ
ncbi:MAG TPA: phosphatidate cytidylyltransferase [Bryobacteraceae bacterium]|jgi:phosphatidate cytidylyltransferase|nr:phosphatidate cytidylyltransferase [Bryobacteraceae bacterium]